MSMLLSKLTRHIRGGQQVLKYPTSLSRLEKKRRTWWSYTVLIIPATAFGLGYWQIQRRKWKLALIESLNARIPADPTPLPLNMTSYADLPEFTPVRIRGHFDHSREIVMGPRGLIRDFILKDGYGSEWVPDKSGGRFMSNNAIPSAPGYCIITPFYLEDRPNTSILVNRGWISFDFRDPISRPKGQVEGTVELCGYVRHAEKHGYFSPKVLPIYCEDYEHQQPHYRYFFREIPEMAERLNTLPILIDANYDSSVPGGPIGGQTRVTFRNEHASYVITWFSLGFVSLGMWIFFYVL